MGDQLDNICPLCEGFLSRPGVEKHSCDPFLVTMIQQLRAPVKEPEQEDEETKTEPKPKPKAKPKAKPAQVTEPPQVTQPDLPKEAVFKIKMKGAEGATPRYMATIFKKGIDERNGESYYTSVGSSSEHKNFLWKKLDSGAIVAVSRPEWALSSHRVSPYR